MSKIEIFEAAGCCATSSVVVSDEAVKWNASAEWAKKHGVNIQRYSLAKNPQQFLNGVLGIFRPKTTKCSGGRAVRGLQRG
ncbi:arsenic metallochaperone ArsD family protein, partial [Klebsiella pneumoniae]|uniref:arsenic metallochaperone ArsD family protein n=1 Tax=Klebsiella pneumoniae TaxID=573 RepID=UPI00292B9A05